MEAGVWGKKSSFSECLIDFFCLFRFFPFLNPRVKEKLQTGLTVADEFSVGGIIFFLRRLCHRSK